eukprot:3941789-Rhodomonas_salina.1
MGYCGERYCRLLRSAVYQAAGTGAPYYAVHYYATLSSYALPIILRTTTLCSYASDCPPLLYWLSTSCCMGCRVRAVVLFCRTERGGPPKQPPGAIGCCVLAYRAWCRTLLYGAMACGVLGYRSSMSADRRHSSSIECAVVMLYSAMCAIHPAESTTRNRIPGTNCTAMVVSCLRFRGVVVLDTQA